MSPQDRILRRMDVVFDERAILRANTKEYAELTGELRGLAWAMVETTRLRLDDIRALVAERAEARAEGSRAPMLLTWLAHRDPPHGTAARAS